jgi:hypothetical protein
VDAAQPAHHAPGRGDGADQRVPAGRGHLSGWPALAPELVARLGLPDAAFDEHLRAFAALLGPRVCEPADVRRALGYPWARPARSFLLADGDVVALAEAPGRAARLAGDGRLPLVAIGSNGAPGALTRKLAHFEDPEDRTVLVVAGHLHGFDVGAAAQPTMTYAALPATLFESPGTAVRAALLWVTPAQFEQLTWSEVSYRLGRLDARFEADEPGFSRDGVAVFVSRFGALGLDGAPEALAAVPARGRRARPRTQEELLDAAARRALGPGASAATLVAAVLADPPAALEVTAAAIRPLGRPFAAAGWTPYPD